MSTRHYGTSDEGGFYFQSESAASKSARRAEKAKGNAGTPLKLNAKLSAVLRDETEAGVVFVADNGGGVRRIDLKVSAGTSRWKCESFQVWRNANGFQMEEHVQGKTEHSDWRSSCEGLG